jgi:hypothetical protein
MWVYALSRNVSTPKTRPRGILPMLSPHLCRPSGVLTSGIVEKLCVEGCFRAELPHPEACSFLRVE